MSLNKKRLIIVILIIVVVSLINTIKARSGIPVTSVDTLVYSLIKAAFFSLGILPISKVITGMHPPPFSIVFVALLVISLGFK
jgi:hypothetical protein